jgi:hypothetical protein
MKPPNLDDELDISTTTAAQKKRASKAANSPTKLTAEALAGSVLSPKNKKTTKKVQIALPGQQNAGTLTRVNTKGNLQGQTSVKGGGRATSVIGGVDMNMTARSMISRKSSAMPVDPYFEKTVEDMDKMIDATWRKCEKEQKKLNRLQRKNDRPSIAIKQEMMDIKREVRKHETALQEYRDVKESKIPYWEKLKDHCADSPYYKFSIQRMIQGGMKSVCDTQNEELSVVKEGLCEKQRDRRRFEAELVRR